MDYESILQKAASGDMNALEDIIRERETKVYSAAFRILKNAADAQDVSQEAFLRVYKHIGRCKGFTYRAFCAWVSTIVNNLCIDHIRRTKRTPVSSLDEKLEMPEGQIEQQIASDEPTPEERAISKEVSTRVSRAIADLPDEHRAAIVLRDILGHSYEEVAAITGAPMGTVKSRIARARATLKSWLGKEEKDDGTK